MRTRSAALTSLLLIALVGCGGGSVRMGPRVNGVLTVPPRLPVRETVPWPRSDQVTLALRIAWERALQRRYRGHTATLVDSPPCSETNRAALGDYRVDYTCHVSISARRRDVTPLGRNEPIAKAPTV